MRILVFGDSIVRGSYDSEYGGWVNRLSALYNSKSVNEGGYFVTYNLGISGELAADLSKRIENELPLRAANTGDEEVVIFLASGINDSKYLLEEKKNGTDLEEFSGIYSEIINSAEVNADHVFCMGLTRVGEDRTDPIPPNNRVSYRNNDIENYEEMIKNCAKQTGATFIEVSDCVSLDLLCPDGIHPNAEGHQLIFERVKEVLKKEGLL